MVSRSNSLTEHREHYDAIDGLRTFSAIAIVMMHVFTNADYMLKGFVFDNVIPSFGNLVFLFMIISGFSMCCGYYDKMINNLITMEQFYSKRYAKAWPYFALLCVLDLLISPSINSLYEVFANLTLCFGLLPAPQMSVIGVGWFLGLVFAFYLLFPFFCYLLSDKRRAWFAFIVTLVFNVFCSDYFSLQRSHFAYSAVFFLAGGIIFLYREQLGKIAEKYRWILLLICATVTGLYYIIGASVLLMLVMFSLYLVYALGIKKNGLLQNPITRFLSGISMEIYLSHMLVYRILEKVRVIHLYENAILSYMVATIGTIIGTVMFAIAFRKGMKIIRKYSRR